MSYYETKTLLFSTIRKAGYVVSISKNKRAAIFRYSDVSVVGDAHVLLPLLVARLEKRTG